MHIDHLSVPSAATDNRSDYNERVFRHKVSYTSLVLRAVARVCREFESQGVGKGQKPQEDCEVEKGLHLEGCRWDAFLGPRKAKSKSQMARKEGEMLSTITKLGAHAGSLGWSRASRSLPETPC